MTDRADGLDAFDVADVKRAVRARMRAVRRVIASDPARRQTRSDEIAERLVGVVEAHRVVGRTTDARPAPARRVMTYEPLPGEVDLSVFHAWCHEHDVEVFTPHIDESAPDEIRVMPGNVDPSTLDVVVVPGVAFTPQGGRLGQGGGHFDRFLPRLAPGCLRVGVAYHEQLVDDLPLESHDIALDHVVTDMTAATT